MHVSGIGLYPRVFEKICGKPIKSFRQPWHVFSHFGANIGTATSVWLTVLAWFAVDNRSIAVLTPGGNY